MQFDYKDLIENSSDLVWEVDTQGKYTYLNSAVKDILGYEKEELLGKSPFDIMPEYEKLKISSFFDEMVKNKKAFKNIENINIHKDGYEVVLETTGSPIINNFDELVGYRGIDRDISEKKKIEKELENLNKKLQKIVDERTVELKKVIERYDFAVKGSSDGLWDWDLETNEVYYSPRWKSMLGYEECELENHIDTWKKLAHKDYKDDVLSQVKEYIEGNNTDFETEIKMHHKNGSIVTVLSRAILVKDDEDKAVRLVGTHVDISERKKTEEFIRKTNNILEMIAKGNLASEVYNEIALMYESRHPGLRCSLLELKDGKLLHGGAPSMPQEYCLAVNGLEIGPNIGSCGTSTYTGQRVIVENIETDSKWNDIKEFALPHGMRSCWSEPIIDSKGKVLGAFGMYYDYPSLPNEEESKDLLSAARLASIVMERDQSQKRINRDQKIISEQNKLSSMGEMIANIAHQWRQPLSVISTVASGMKIQKQMGILKDNEFDHYMDTINESTQYLSKTIDDFRGFLNPSNNRLKKFSIIEIIDKTLKIVSTQILDNDIEIIKNIEKNSLVSLENELIQVIINLLNNARDALLNIDNKKKLIFINSYKKGNSLYIEIFDNAGGIKKEYLSRIFEPYFTTKHKSKGTGIGLYMSQDILKTLLNGDISVENNVFSKDGIEYLGAKFTIKLDI